LPHNLVDDLAIAATGGADPGKQRTDGVERKLPCHCRISACELWSLTYRELDQTFDLTISLEAEVRYAVTGGVAE
jgi:hypothetical protein